MKRRMKKRGEKKNGRKKQKKGEEKKDKEKKEMFLRCLQIGGRGERRVRRREGKKERLQPSLLY